MEITPRLAPLDTASSLGVWLFFRLCRRLLGKVMTPARVIYARMPRLLFPQLLMFRLARGLSLPPLLVHRVQVRVSLRNGCAFCTDIHQAMALRDGFAHDDLAALSSPGAELQLDPAHRAALQYTDELCANEHACDATFASLHASFTERQIVELTWLYAFTTYLNRLAGALRIGSDGFCAAPAKTRSGNLTV
jgi:AhpD family alkylhydroperoxidase